MGYKNLDEQRAYQREWATKKRAEGSMHQQKMQQLVVELKDNQPCVDCGKSYRYWVMDFDHVRGEKVNGVSFMVRNSKAALLKEVEKCDLVCSNCHRTRTHLRAIETGKIKVISRV